MFYNSQRFAVVGALAVVMAFSGVPGLSPNDAPSQLSGLAVSGGDHAGVTSMKTARTGGTAERAGEACPDGGDRPVPTEVTVTEVPIEVASTTEDYFVLYAGHDGEGATIEYPVLVALGEEGTTTLSENVAPLPVERYRVEKYLVADPADVDGDCIDDLTELRAMGEMNPVNPAPPLGVGDVPVAIADRETFERITHIDHKGVSTVKFAVLDVNTTNPKIYFQDTNQYEEHEYFLEAIGTDWRNAVRGKIVYDPALAAPDGSRGVYRYRLGWYRPVVGETFDLTNDSFSLVDRVHTLLAASMPLVDDNLALWIREHMLYAVQSDLPLFRASRIPLLFNDDIYGETDFLALNPGDGYGVLASLDPDERPGPRDVVIYRTLPNELPRVAGVISAEPQTTLSHVNLRAVQDRIPNAFVAGALEDEHLTGLIGRYVHYAVDDDGYTIRAVTPAEVEEHYAAIRPTEVQRPMRDLSVTRIAALGDVEFDDWDSFGVKAANLAVLGRLDLGEGTVPDGFAIPFYFYDEFMKHNDLYGYIEEMLAEPGFGADYDTQVDELKKLRKKIKKAETPEWIEAALEEMHAAFPEGTSLRYRSSTNNEDLPGFNGAGLYDSKTQHPAETEEDGISKSLKQVYASLWNYRAFVERDFHRIDHLAAAMGVLVHPNYSDERVNGVAVSADPAYGTEETYYVNSQIGEDLVTNPDPYSVPEEVLLFPEFTPQVVAASNQVPPGQLLMTLEHLRQLRRHLTTIHDKFAELYGVENGEPFAMEIEFKVTAEGNLAIKQARPWVFALTGSFDTAPPTHDGTVFNVRVAFSEGVSISEEEFTDHAVEVEGGRVTDARRVDGRDDLWEVRVTADSLADVTMQIDGNRPCTVVGAICTHDGRRLSTTLGSVAAGPPPYVPGNAPARPDNLRARPLWVGMIDLAWSNVPGAESYDVQYFQWIEWIDLPGSDIDITFYGPGAAIRNLPIRGSDFRVRAVNSHGVSEWSDLAFIRTTDGPAAWRGVPEPVNSAAEGAPVIEVAGLDPQTLTADVSTISDPNGLERVWFHYQWVSGDGAEYMDIEGATGPDYRPTGEEEGGQVAVRVSFVDNHGFTESVTSLPFTPTASRPNREAWGAPTIAGTVRVGETLTADTSAVVDEDGLDETTFDYQWVLSDGATEADIAGATGATYTLTGEDTGRRVKVRVSFTDDAGNQEILTSEATASVGDPLVWEGELTAGLGTHTAPAGSGYSSFGAMEGTLSPNGWQWEGVSYRIRFLAHLGEGLWLGTDPALPRDFSLRVGDSIYRGGDSLVSRSINGVRGYWWPAASSDWIPGRPVRASLSLHQEVLPERAKAPVIGYFSDFPSEHDGESDISFRVWFTEGVDLTDDALRHQVLAVTGGEVSGVMGYGGAMWAVSVRPDSSDTVRVEIEAGSDCATARAVCAPDGRRLFNRMELTVRGGRWTIDQDTSESEDAATAAVASPLGAEVRAVPSNHRGRHPFTFELRFSEEPVPGFSYRTLRDRAFSVRGGTVVRARRLAPPGNVAWEITIRPHSYGEVTVVLPITRHCDDHGAICTGDGRMLSEEVRFSVPGPGRGGNKHGPGSK